MRDIKEVLESLSKSKFRARFHLKQKDFDYIDKIGMEKIEEHAKDFIETRLSKIENLVDGKQTPMRGHPVFIAQHATATCCRDCLFKWHRIKKDRPLTEEESLYIKDLIMTWIKRELKRSDNVK